MSAYGEISLDRMVRAVEKVRERLLRSTAVLEAAGIPYAIAGGNAVAAWVSQVDEAAVRNTPNVDLLINRCDLSRTISVLEAEDFNYQQTSGVHAFFDDSVVKIRHAVRVWFAEEKMCPEYLSPSANVRESEVIQGLCVLSLDAVVRMKLISFRVIDKVHLRDMLDIGLIDSSWTSRYPAELAAKLQHLIDTPEG